MYYVIENKVPLPLKYRKDVDPWVKMRVGESILVPNDEAYNAYQRARYHGKKMNKSFCSKGEFAGQRIWRVK